MRRPATVVLLESKEKTAAPPKLYDLTSLQREANRDHGFTSDQTLTLIQSLYEKKLATYPRTDSRYLTSDMADIIPVLVKGFSSPEAPCNTRQVLDDTRVSDHHAIIPTMTSAGTDRSVLPDRERIILDMLIKRLLEAVGDKHIYTETSVTLSCEGYEFKAKVSADDRRVGI